MSTRITTYTDWVDKLIEDTYVLARLATFEFDHDIFWSTDSPKAVYARTEDHINKCVMQPGHTGSVENSIPQHAKPTPFAHVALQIPRVSLESPPVFQEFFPTIDDEFIDAMQDFVDALWLREHMDVERAQQLSDKVQELNSYPVNENTTP